MQKLFLLSGSILGGLGVAIGAFGAHGLKAKLEAINKVEVFEKGVHYQFFHALALLAIGLLLEKYQDKMLVNAGYCMLIGTIIFSFSLYILCLTNIGKFGAITPIGGILMIAGWILLSISISRSII